MGEYTVTLFGTQHPNEVSGIITSGALTRYNKKLFGEVDKQIDMNSYFDNVLSEGLCSDQEVVEKYALDDLNAKQISMGLVSTLIEGIKYLKENGLVSYKDSLQLFDEIGSEHKSIHIYDGLQHEIFNESSFNKSIFKEIVDWLDNEMQ